MPEIRLAELYARNIGVIDDVLVQFSPGFNVITGETGTGKTLLLDALGLCLGADSEHRGALGEGASTVAIFEERGIERAFARELTDSGRLRASIDAVPTSADALRTASKDYVTVHGQHDALKLRARGDILARIDQSGAISDTHLRELRRDLRVIEDELAANGGDNISRQREEEYLRFQIEEFDQYQVLDIDELERTLLELTRLGEIRDAQQILIEVVSELDGDGDDAVLPLLAMRIDRLKHLSVLSDEVGRMREHFEALRQDVRDVVKFINPDSVDDERFRALENRAAVLSNLARKHGGSLSDAFNARASYQTRIDELAAFDADRQEREVRREALHQEIVECERVLASRRRETAERLNAAVAEQLPRVALEGCTVRFITNGIDGSDAAIAFRPRGSATEGALGDLASGGELSRVLLAIALVCTDERSVAVFDEIDAGLGGHVAQQIGECLFELGRHQQVLAVTHLASVAARADTHLVITRDGVSRVRRVEGDERVGEIARMLAGRPTPESRSLAQRLLNDAATVRE